MFKNIFSKSDPKNQPVQPNKEDLKNCQMDRDNLNLKYKFALNDIQKKCNKADADSKQMKQMYQNCALDLQSYRLKELKSQPLKGGEDDKYYEKYLKYKNKYLQLKQQI